MSYIEFIAEGKKGLTNAGSIMKTDAVKDVQVAINYADESLETLRRNLLDKFFDMAETEEQKRIINKCISTYVWCMDKKLRIDGDILDRLGKEVGMTNAEISKLLSKETDSFYGKVDNLYGRR